MNFIVRPVQEKDLVHLENLASQFSLLNLPPDKKIISEKIQLSNESFAGRVPVEKATYMLVTEDLENNWVVGSSQVKAQHGSEQNPTYSFKLNKKEMFSKSLGVGFIHQVLSLKTTTNGPSEFGGLVVHKGYRRRPEKVGKLTSLSRFVFAGMNSELFKEEWHAEMAPPLTDEGRSEFWEALGRRFTGMPYQEADRLSHQNKEFIESLFPKEDIHLALLDSQARLVMGRVSDQTAGALHLLQKIGFKDKNEIDPFDGGPHFGVKKEDVTLIKNSQTLELMLKGQTHQDFDSFGLIGVGSGANIRVAQSSYVKRENKIILPEPILRNLELSAGEKIFVTHE